MTDDLYIYGGGEFYKVSIDGQTNLEGIITFGDEKLHVFTAGEMAWDVGNIEFAFYCFQKASTIQDENQGDACERMSKILHSGVWDDDFHLESNRQQVNKYLQLSISLKPPPYEKSDKLLRDH